METNQSKEKEPLNKEKEVKDTGISLNSVRRTNAAKKFQIISAQKMKKLIKQKNHVF